MISVNEYHSQLDFAHAFSSIKQTAILTILTILVNFHHAPLNALKTTLHTNPSTAHDYRDYILFADQPPMTTATIYDATQHIVVQ